MIRINARSLLAFDSIALWDILTGKFTLVFDDGELEVTARETLYSFYAWNLHREYPNTPLLKKHHVKTVIGDKRLGSNTHLELLGNCAWSVYDTYINYLPASGWEMAENELRDKIAKRVYQITNEMYSDLSHRLEEFVVSLDITDFINVISHPSIKKANDEVVATKQSIEETYSAIKDTLFNSPDLDKNPLALAARSSLVSIGQTLQCIGPRGYLTDTDSNEFPTPVLRGYTQGMRKFIESFIESRSAAKSLIFSKSPLQQAEYFSRRLQIMSQVVQNLHYGDCGSTQYSLWKVRDEVKVNGVVKRPGDLKQLVGKHYLDNDGVLKTIYSDSKELIGRTLKLRTVIHCGHPDPYGICSVCFGELSLSVPAKTNIGQMCCTSLAQKSSQNVLSVKHLDGSSVIAGIEIIGVERDYLSVASDDNSYMLSDKLKGKHVTLVIRADQATNITDIMDVGDIESLNITRVSELSEIGIMVKIADGVHIESFDVTLNDRKASMTHSLLRYIRSHNWGVDDKGNYTIEMADWDWSKSILTLPLKHFNMSDHSKDIASMIESSVDKLHERDNIVSADNALVELFDLVNDKLSVNIAVLDVVLYGTMIVSAEGRDYSLPKPWTDNGLGIMRMSMANRSLSAAMAYEGHRDVLVSPISYISSNRVDHPFDRLLCYYD